jgi:hypothetical protein
MPLKMIIQRNAKSRVDFHANDYLQQRILSWTQTFGDKMDILPVVNRWLQKGIMRWT